MALAILASSWTPNSPCEVASNWWQWASLTAWRGGIPSRKRRARGCRSWTSAPATRSSWQILESPHRLGRTKPSRSVSHLLLFNGVKRISTINQCIVNCKGNHNRKPCLLPPVIGFVSLQNQSIFGSLDPQSCWLPPHFAWRNGQFYNSTNPTRSISHLFSDIVKPIETTDQWIGLSTNSAKEPMRSRQRVSRMSCRISQSKFTWKRMPSSGCLVVGNDGKQWLVMWNR